MEESVKKVKEPSKRKAATRTDDNNDVVDLLVAQAKKNTEEPAPKRARNNRMAKDSTAKVRKSGHCGDETTTTTKNMTIVQFYSKSKDADDLGRLGEGPSVDLPIPNWRKVLSNFHLVPIAVKGKTYPSVEHYFHAAKAMCSNRPEYAREFETQQGSIGRRRSPLDAKRAGSKTGFAKVGATLNVGRWIRCRDRAVARALKARARVDPLFRQILHETRRRRLYLLHFERGGAKSYWGGSISKASHNNNKQVGTNRLGVLLMILRDILAKEEMDDNENVNGDTTPDNDNHSSS